MTDLFCNHKLRNYLKDYKLHCLAIIRNLECNPNTVNLVSSKFLFYSLHPFKTQKR